MLQGDLCQLPTVTGIRSVDARDRISRCFSQFGEGERTGAGPGGRLLYLMVCLDQFTPVRGNRTVIRLSFLSLCYYLFHNILF